MLAMIFEQPGNPDVMHLAAVPDPAPRDGELLVRVHASALNRADLLQRLGGYPPRPGESDILGLEFAGVVVALGPGVTAFRAGDRVYGLAGGGGYAQLATIHESLAMPTPANLSCQEAASIPEVFFTAHDALVTLGGLAAGGTALVHAGGSGVGIAAIQIVKAMNGRVIITAGSDDKCQRALALGADLAVNYHTGNFAEEVHRFTDRQGVHVILDVVGGPYWAANIASLARRGRLIIVGLMGGPITEVDLGQILSRRLRVEGTAMRSRSLEERALVRGRYQRDVEPHVRAGTIRPVIDTVFPLRAAAEAHQYMGANLNFGKIVLDVEHGC